MPAGAGRDPVPKVKLAPLLLLLLLPAGAWREPVPKRSAGVLFLPAGAGMDPEPKLNPVALPLADGADVVAVGAAAAAANPKPPPPPEALVAATVVGAAEAAVVLLLLPSRLNPKEGTLAGDDELLPPANGLDLDMVTGAAVVAAPPDADELPKRPATGAVVLSEDAPKVKPPEGAEEPTPAALAAAATPLLAPSDAVVVGCAPNVKPLLAGAAEVVVGAGG